MADEPDITSLPQTQKVITFAPPFSWRAWLKAEYAAIVAWCEKENAKRKL